MKGLNRIQKMCKVSLFQIKTECLSISIIRFVFIDIISVDAIFLDLKEVKTVFTTFFIMRI